KRFALEALDEHEVARPEMAANVRKSEFGLVAKLAHKCKSPRRRKGDLRRPGLTQLERIAAGMVDIETLVGMLDDRDDEAAMRQLRHKTGHQRRLSGVFPAGHAEQWRIHR